MHLHRFARALAACLICVGTVPLFPAIPAVAQQSGTDVTGRIFDAGSGLPISGANVELLQGDKRVADTKSTGDGSFTFKNEPQGIYNVVISASGYQGTRSSDLVVTSGQAVIQLQMALQRGSSNSGSLRTIAAATVGGRAALQTTTTINKSLDPAVLQTQDYMRAGDALATVPGVNAGTSSAVGDDLSISIRGFNPSETATLLDGHPIGPIGAQGGSFDYQDSPFWGIRNTQVVFGSGATGIYGATTIAGAVDFQTLDPTQTPHGKFMFGIGNDGKSMTGAAATGTVGKLGYAAAWAVQGTYGMFEPQVIPQTGLLGNDLTRANLAANTYLVSGNYTLHNGLLKLSYAFDPTSTLTVTGYSATSWDDKSGNGDTDFNTYQGILYNTQQALASGPIAAITLPNGSSLSCGTTGVPVFADTPSGGECLTPQQYAAQASGPAGGGEGPWQAIRNQDYHLRYLKSVGSHTVTIDGFFDNYALDYNRSIASGISPVCNCFTGFFQTNFYHTNGYLLSDDFLTGRHDISFGFYAQRQQHANDRFAVTASDASGNPTAYGIVWKPQYALDSNLYFLRDQYQPSSRLSLFADLWLNHTNVTNGNSFDPRFTAMWRPDGSDVVRVTAGHANNVPDPALALSPVNFDTNYNALNPNCSGLTSVASGGNPSLKPESASDVEASYGHRFANNSTVEVDGYSAYEQNALFGGMIPLAQLGVLPSQAVLTQIFGRVSQFCPNIPDPTIGNLGATVTYNAAAARYQGVTVSGRVNLARFLQATADYGIQSAVYLGVPDSILASNQYVINNAQIAGVPFHKADIGFGYNNPSGIGATIDGHFIDTNNGWNRPAFWFANASISNNFGPFTLNFGVNNLFNSAASAYGLIGLGTYTPVNALNASSYPNALAEGSEEYGLPYRQGWMTVSWHF
jgi:outer membrane receptor protein involved in Fe transport